MSLREQYHLPRRPPFPFRMALAMGVVAGLVLALWLVGPRTAWFLGILFVIVAVAVAAGVFLAASSRRLQRPPGRVPLERPPRRVPGPPPEPR